MKLLIYCSGIFVSYFIYGILQEKVTRSTYGEQKEKFTFFYSLVLIQCIVNAIFAKILLKTIMKQGPDGTRFSYYATSALTYLSAMLCSNMALGYVNYPTQVVAKSCKPVPVMILGVLFGGKKYPIAKYLFVFMIVTGVSLFMYKDKKTSTQSPSSGSILGWGEILLLLSLTMDGLLGAIQERMKAEHSTKSCHMMYNLNLCSVVYLIPLVFFTGEYSEFFLFVNKYPLAMYNIGLFSIMSAIGQVFIYLIVADFGPLPCSIITTVRKFFTVIASVIFFGNTIISRQWMGAALVFTGLGLDSIYGKNAAKKMTK
ncbi:solute carrier family 35 member B1-like [Brevipalpus obovatus]|uniref:solute carrier family 35 member B1-like n=1 Tax=Brevipalpus obovatus TaxID=246614 RepID=UPI003D9F46AD